MEITEKIIEKILSDKEYFSKYFYYLPSDIQKSIYEAVKEQDNNVNTKDLIIKFFEEDFKLTHDMLYLIADKLSEDERKAFFKASKYLQDAGKKYASKEYVDILDIDEYSMKPTMISNVKTIDEIIGMDITHIEFADYFNDSIDNLPKGIKSIKFGNNFNQEIKIPDGVEEISFGTSFNQRIDTFPDSIKSITYKNIYNRMPDYITNILPNSLEELYICCCNSNDTLDFSRHKIKNTKGRFSH